MLLQRVAGCRSSRSRRDDPKSELLRTVVSRRRLSHCRNLLNFVARCRQVSQEFSFSPRGGRIAVHAVLLPPSGVPQYLRGDLSRASRICFLRPLVHRGCLVAVPDQGGNSQSWAMQARSRLALRCAEKPATKAGQIRALWPDIEAAFAAGQAMKTICAWLAEDAGTALGVPSLTSYISRIRRQEATNRRAPVPLPPRSIFDAARTRVTPSEGPAADTVPKPVRAFDPLANLSASQAKRLGFHYRPATAEDAKDLI